MTDTEAARKALVAIKDYVVMDGEAALRFHLIWVEAEKTLSALSPKSEEEKWSIRLGDWHGQRYGIVTDTGVIIADDIHLEIAQRLVRLPAIERAAVSLLNHIERITYRDLAGLRLSRETVPHVGALRRAVEEGAEG